MKLKKKKWPGTKKRKKKIMMKGMKKRKEIDEEVRTYIENEKKGKKKWENVNEINEWNKPKEVKEKMEHKYESREQVKQKSNRRKVTYYKK